jgi:AraC-like DNA-binding protein
MLLIQLVFFVLFPNWGSFLQKWWYYLFFAVLHYYIAVKGYVNNMKGALPFYIYRLPQTPIMALPNVSPLALPMKYTLLPYVVEEEIPFINNEIESSEALNNWKEKLKDLVWGEELYKNSQLTLLDIATILNTHPTLISRMVNKGYNMNFNDWINSYRVTAIILMLQNNEHKTQTLLGISINCGFNSKSSFNRCFKKFTGSSPKDFIKKLVPNHDIERLGH